MNQPIPVPQTQSLLVSKSIHVATTPERAFRVFTEQLGTWWPLVSHHIGQVAAVTAVVEPFAGGRWFERGVDGTECLWGHVKVWQPPGRLVLSWELNCQWAYDPGQETEVEVRFIPEGNGTRVELEHRMLERYGDKAEQMAAALGGEGGWGNILALFGRTAEAAA
ncbi:SRPBCC family protein [Nannocystis pusilla]|uniref:SRPBCC family protein n=1 Tax=Nannocystis pusilla TaxID=889268 RepID=UPI003B791E95